MPDIKKTTKYGGSGIIILLFIIVELIIFAKKGMHIYMIAVLLVGVAAVLAFNFEAEPWLRRHLEKRYGKEATPEERRRQSRIIDELARRGRLIWKKEEEEVPRVVAAATKVIAALKSITSKEARKPTIGEEIKTVEEAKSEIKKSLEVLTVEVTTSKRFLLKAVDNLEKEHAAVAAKVKEMKKRKKEFSGLAKSIGRNIERYSKALRGIDKENKIKKLQTLEIELGTKEKSDIDRKVLEEIGAVESSCNYLVHLTNEIADTAKELQREIPPEWRDKKYDAMMASLDKMDRSIRQEFSPEVSRLREAVVLVSQRRRNFDERMSGLKQSELVEIRLEQQAKAELAAANADEATKNIENLTQDLTASEAENSQLKQNVEKLGSQLGDVNTTIAKWQLDIERAREAVAKKPELEPNLRAILSKNVEEQTGLIITIISSLMAQEDYAASCKKRADNAQTAADEAKEKVKNLTTENQELTGASSTAKEQIEDLDEKIQELKEEKERSEKEAAKTTEQTIRKEYETKLEEINSQLKNKQTELDKAVDTNTYIETELAKVNVQLKEANKQVEELAPQVPGLKKEAKSAKESLETTKAALAKVTAEKNTEINQLKEKTGKLESDNTGLKSNLKKKEKTIRELNTEIDHARKEIDNYTISANNAWSQVGSFEDKLKEYKDTKEKLDRELKELTSKNANLNLELGEKASIARERLKNLRDLQKLYKAEVRPAQESAEKLKESNRRFEKYSNRLKEELKELKEKQKELEAIPEDAVDERTKKQLEMLNEKIEKLKSTIGERDREIRERDEEIKKEKEKIRQAAVDAAQLEVELEHAELEHKRATQEIRALAESYRKGIDTEQTRIDELHGRVYELENKDNAIEEKLKELGMQISEKWEQIKTARAAEEEDRAVQLIEERNELLRQEIELTKEKFANAGAVRELLRRLEETHIKFKEDYSSYKSSAETEKEELTKYLGTAGEQITELEVKIEDQNSEIKRLKSETAAPENIDEWKRQIAKKEREIGKSKEAYNELNKELEETKAKLLKLEVEMEKLPSRIEEEIKEAETDEERRIQAEMVEFFFEFTQPVLDKIGTMHNLYHKDPQQALATAEDILKDIDNIKRHMKLLPEETQQVDLWAYEANQLKDEIEAGLAKKAKVKPKETKPKAAKPKPGKIGVIQFASGEYAATISQFESAGQTEGKTVPQIVLDPGKKSILFGRIVTKTPNIPFKDQPNDVVIWSHSIDIKQISRKHFEIILTGSEYRLFYRGSYPAVAMGRTSKGSPKRHDLKKGSEVTLSDGMEITLGREGDFKFVFKMLDIEDVKRSQSLEWFKTSVYLSERPAEEKKAPEEAEEVAPLPKKKGTLGYLALPNHARLAEQTDEGLVPKKDFGFIVLNKDTVRIGRDPKCEINIQAHKDYKFKQEMEKKGKEKFVEVSANETLSSIQATITKEGDKYFIEDNSKYGTFVNEKRTAGKTELKHGDTIHFGILHYGETEPFFFVFGVREFTPSEQREWQQFGVLFDFHNLELPKDVKKRIGKGRGIFSKIFGT